MIHSEPSISQRLNRLYECTDGMLYCHGLDLQITPTGTTAEEEEEEEEANSGYAFTIALNTVFSSAFIEELYTICYHEQTTSEEVIQVFTHLLPFLLFKYALKVT